jgi:hypothetical protein
MSPDDHRKRQTVRRRHSCREDSDDQALPHAIAEDAARRKSHGHRGFSCCDHSYGVRGNISRRQRRLDEVARVNRSYSSPGDRQEIVSKCVERTSQCVRFGSDQADRPVTMSNFLRSDATN